LIETRTRRREVMSKGVISAAFGKWLQEEATEEEIEHVCGFLALLQAFENAETGKREA